MPQLQAKGEGKRVEAQEVRITKEGIPCYVRFASFGMLRPVHSSSEPNAAFVNDVAPVYDIPPKNARPFKPSEIPVNHMAFVNVKVPDSTAMHVKVKTP